MKTQMRFQKILALITLIVSALAIVYGLIFSSPVADMGTLVYVSSSYSYGNSPINADDLYYYSQIFNDILLILGIVFIVFVAFMYLSATNKRRNYYVTNYVASIAAAVMAILCALTIVIAATVCLNMFLNDVDWDTFLWYHNNKPDAYSYSKNPSVYTIGFVFALILIADAVLLILNLKWKIKLMKGEKALLEGGLVKEVA